MWEGARRHRRQPHHEVDISYFVTKLLGLLKLGGIHEGHQPLEGVVALDKLAPVSGCFAFDHIGHGVCQWHIAAGFCRKRTCDRLVFW